MSVIEQGEWKIYLLEKVKQKQNMLLKAPKMKDADSKNTENIYSFLFLIVTKDYGTYDTIQPTWTNSTNSYISNTK